MSGLTTDQGMAAIDAKMLLLSLSNLVATDEKAAASARQGLTGLTFPALWYGGRTREPCLLLSPCQLAFVRGVS
jgi:hypothetical protein